MRYELFYIEEGWQHSTGFKSDNLKAATINARFTALHTPNKLRLIDHHTDKVIWVSNGSK